jgi:hypothetical protein
LKNQGAVYGFSEGKVNRKETLRILTGPENVRPAPLKKVCDCVRLSTHKGAQ